MLGPLRRASGSKAPRRRSLTLLLGSKDAEHDLVLIGTTVGRREIGNSDCSFSIEVAHDAFGSGTTYSDEFRFGLY